MNILIFMWIGLTAPWDQMTELFPIWRLFVMGIFIMVFRRLPAVLALYKWIPSIVDLREALFSGFFGPIGVGALFYLTVLIENLEATGYTESDWLVEVARPVVYFCILSSIVTHGFAIPLISIVLHGRRKIRRRIKSQSARCSTADLPDDINVEEEEEFDDII
jgi:NhaP-type Na+/H+ or K+/H+ antiporter